MARAWFSLLLLLKLPVLILLMTMAVWLVVNRVASPFALLAGVAVVHTAIVASAARSWLLTVLKEDHGDLHPRNS